MKAATNPQPGRKPGDLEFRFRRSGLTLAVDYERVNGRPWISAMLWMRDQKAKPGQLVNVHGPAANWYLRAPCPELTAALCYVGSSLALRDGEYESLRAALLPLGLVHHVPASAAVEAPAPRAQAPAPLEVTRGDGRRVSVTVPAKQEHDVVLRAAGVPVEGDGQEHGDIMREILGR